MIPVCPPHGYILKILRNLCVYLVCIYFVCVCDKVRKRDLFVCIFLCFFRSVFVHVFAAYFFVYTVCVCACVCYLARLFIYLSSQEHIQGWASMYVSLLMYKNEHSGGHFRYIHSYTHKDFDVSEFCSLSD